MAEASASRFYHIHISLLSVLPTDGDATEAFEDVGHSDEARELLPGMLVGEFDNSSGVRINIICHVKILAYGVTGSQTL